MIEAYRPPVLVQTGPIPPACFRRLDKYIQSNGLRAWDVFFAMDHNQNKTISYEELIDGLHQINFTLSPTDQAEVLEWMTNADDGVTFKEFTLALKLRASSTSPPRKKRLSNGAKKILTK
ncbi:hypothetical protein THRCLA_22053 [Thraustotheca clavata]|uniref:EF-hand domain-containing protein n=1 Tax=Thraustotheca clavata TaxID=74557 RepID=A0A1V9ZD61_9STRA|nr:hypothetical protein THRCLA_22053 [Thraustotheca clavata]